MIKRWILLLISILLFLTSDPVIGFWPGVILSFFIFIKLQKDISREGDLKHSFFLTFFFYFFIKLIVLRGFFEGLLNLYANHVAAVGAYSILITIESLLPAILACLLFYSFKMKAKSLIIILSTLILVLMNALSSIWIPQGIEYPLAQNKYLLSSYGLLGTWGVSCCIFLFILHFSFAEKKIRTFSLSLLLLPFLLGFLRIEFFNKFSFSHYSFILVQTNQSESDLERRALDWEKIEGGIRKFLSKDKSSTVVFPEYTTTTQNPYFEKFIQSLSEDNNVNFIIGVEAIAHNGIMNQIWHFEGNKIVAKSDKIIPFPIGESEVELGFLPNSWVKPKVPVLTENNFNSFRIDGAVLYPLICYDGVFLRNYLPILNTPQSIVLHLSKDGYLEKTSAMDWLDLVIRTKVSMAGKSTIRVGTNSYTEIVLPWGEALEVFHPHRFMIKEVQVPVYERNFSLFTLYPVF